MMRVKAPQKYGETFDIFHLDLHLVTSGCGADFQLGTKIPHISTKFWEKVRNRTVNMFWMKNLNFAIWIWIWRLFSSGHKNTYITLIFHSISTKISGITTSEVLHISVIRNQMFKIWIWIWTQNTSWHQISICSIDSPLISIKPSGIIDNIKAHQSMIIYFPFSIWICIWLHPDVDIIFICMLKL